MPAYFFDRWLRQLQLQYDRELLAHTAVLRSEKQLADSFAHANHSACA